MPQERSRKREDPKLPTHREAVLLACLLDGERTGVEIGDEVEKREGKTLPVGSLYMTLHRMVGKGFLVKRFGKPAPERGRLRPLLFKIAAPGCLAWKAYESRPRLLTLMGRPTMA